MAAARIRSCRWTRYSKMKCPLRAALSTAWRARPPGKCSGCAGGRGRSLQDYDRVPFHRIPGTALGTKTARGSDYGREPIQIPSASFREIRASNDRLALDILSPRHDEGDDSFRGNAGRAVARGKCMEIRFHSPLSGRKEALTRVIYEPWHFRYVGKQAAKEIYQSGQCLEEYAGGNS